MKDQLAVAVLKDGEIVGHIPYDIAFAVSHFLRRDSNKAFAEVTGDRVNSGAGYGMEIPCTYRFYGPEPYIRRMKEILEHQSLHADVDQYCSYYIITELIYSYFSARLPMITQYSMLHPCPLRE